MDRLERRAPAVPSVCNGLSADRLPAGERKETFYAWKPLRSVLLVRTAHPTAYTCWCCAGVCRKVDALKRNGVFYGWILVAAGCVVMATTMGLVMNCNSLFIKPIADDLGLSRESVSITVSVLNFGSMLASFFAGRIFNEENIVRVMRAAIVTTVVVYFTNSMAQSVQFLYVTYFINGIMMSLVTTLPLTFLINNWFVDKVGVALGLTSMGSGLGGAVFNAIAGAARACGHVNAPSLMQRAAER